MCVKCVVYHKLYVTRYIWLLYSYLLYIVFQNLGEVPYVGISKDVLGAASIKPRRHLLRRYSRQKDDSTQN